MAAGAMTYAARPSTVVTTGQMVTAPAQTVVTTGQMVAAPAQTVVTTGQMVAAAPPSRIVTTGQTVAAASPATVVTQGQMYATAEPAVVTAGQMVTTAPTLVRSVASFPVQTQTAAGTQSGMDLFDRLDVNKDGAISREEFQAAVQGLR